VIAEDDPLCDTSLERAVVGAVLIDPDVFHSVAAMVEPADFADLPARIVWEAMRAVAVRGQPIALDLLAGEIRTSGKLAAIGGVGFLGEITDRTVTSAWADVHAAAVADLAARRRAREALGALSTWAADPKRTLAEMQEKAHATLLALGKRDAAKTCTAAEGIEALVTDLERPAAQTPGLPTPITALTRLTSGWQDGQLIVIAARPSVGKTAFALQCVLSLGETGHGVLLCSLETQRLPLMRRLVASRAEIPLDVLLRRRQPDAHEHAAMGAAMGEIARMDLVVADGAHQGLASIRAEAFRAHALGKLHCVVIDYLQLMATTARRDGTREREVAELARGLKVLATDLKVPVIVLSQLSRKVEEAGRKPRLSDLRESGAIEQDADVVIFLHREGDGEGEDPTETVDLILAKQRDGARGVEIPLTYRKNATRFYDTGGVPPSMPSPTWGDA